MALDMPFNVRSGQQMQDYLYNFLKLQPLSDMNDKGNYSVAVDVLTHYAEKEGNEFCSLLIDYRKLQKCYNTYVKGIEKYISEKDGNVHADFSMSTTETFRSCICKGTFIETVRDNSKYPKGVKIENVSIGDYVYCFDDNLQPTIKKVLWAGKTGKRELVRIHWKAKGFGDKGKKTGYLDCTPEHLIRLINGSYVEARNLLKRDYRTLFSSNRIPKTSVLSLSRNNDELAFANVPLKYGKGIKEHRFIYQQLVGELKDEEIIHHVDGNHYNNNVCNLEKTNKSLHSKKHYPDNIGAEKAKKKSIRAIKKRWKDGKNDYLIKHGKDHHNYIGMTKYQTLKKLAEYGGRISKTDIDFETIKRYCNKYDIDIKSVSLRYDKEWKFISRGKLIKLLEKYGYSKVEVIRSFGIGQDKLNRLIEFYNIVEPKHGELNNHYITKVEYLGYKDDVYDIEVEDVHNFIANGICVHNSSQNPNFQNISKHGEIIKGIPWTDLRKIFSSVKENEYVLEADYVGAEVKICAMLTDDNQLIDDLNNDMDQHSHWANVIFGLNKDYGEIKRNHKDERFLAKNNFTFANLFGAGSFSIAANFREHDFYINYVRDKYNQIEGRKAGWDKFFVEYSEEHISECQNEFYKRYFKVKEWQDKIVHDFYEIGYVDNPFGFKRRFPLKRNEIINFPIQSTSFHLLLDSLIKIERQMKELGMNSRLCGQVHDSGFFVIDIDEAEEVMDLIKYEMENKPELKWTQKVKLEAEIEIGKTWEGLKLEHAPFRAKHIKSGEILKYNIMHWFARDFGFDESLVSKVLAKKEDAEGNPLTINGWDLYYTK